MKILVIGASGFIGRAVQKHFAAVGTVHSCRPQAKDNTLWCDITKRQSVIDLVRAIEPDVVYHCAAMAVPSLSRDLWPEMWNVNTIGTMNVAMACAGRKLVFLSSINVYGPGTHSKYDSLNPTTLYAASKIAGENIIGVSGVDHRIVRLPGVLGAGMTHGIIHDFAKKLKQDGPLEILGNPPGTAKPYVHIDTLCQYLHPDVLWGQNQKIVTICPKDCVTADTIATIMIQNGGHNKEKKWTGSSFSGDINRITVASDFDCPSSLEAVQKAICEY